MTNENYERLQEIREEMEQLLNESKQIIVYEGDNYERAKTYWINDIENALWGCYNPCSMDKTIFDVEPEEDLYLRDDCQCNP